MVRKSEEDFQIKKKIWQLESFPANISHPLPWKGVIFNFFSQLPLLSSYHVWSSPQEKGEQAFHTVGAIHFWVDLPATVVSGIHASRDKSACQHISHVYIGHKLMPAFFFFFFFLVLPSIPIHQNSPINSFSFPFVLNCPWKPLGFISSGKEEEKYSMDWNWFCRSCEIC